MNIQLNKFEQKIDEEYLDNGHRMYQRKAVSELQEFDANLWVAKVREGDEHPEVEVLLSAHKIKHTTCECHVYQHHEMCAHIVACLFALRDHLSETTPPANRDQTSNKPSQMSTRRLINKIQSDDLEQFVLAYARSDDEFALALRVRFASRIDLTDNLKKYRQILRQIKRRSLRSSTLSKRLANRMFQWFDEMAKESRDSFISGLYSEAGWCYLAMILELNELWDKVVARQEKQLKELIDRVHRDLRELFNHRKVPALFKDHLLEEIIEFLRSGSYVPPNPILNLFEIGCTFSRHRNDELLQLLERDLNQGNQPKVRLTLRLAAYMHLMHHHLNDTTYDPALDISPEYWIRSAEYLEQSNPSETIPWYYELFEQLDCDQYRFRLAKRMLQQPELSEHPVGAVEVAAYAIKEMNDREGLNLIDDWPNALKAELLQRIQDYESEIDAKLLTFCTHVLGKHDAVEDLLLNRIPLEDFHEIKEVLLDLDEETLYDLLQSKIDTFLRDHFGKPAERIVQKTLYLLQQNSRGSVSKRLMEQLNKSYNKRTSFHLKEDDQ